MDNAIRLEAFDAGTARPAQLASINALQRALTAEGRPGDPLPTLQMTTTELTWQYPDYQSWHWIAWRDERAIAMANAELSQSGPNPHLLSFWIGVAPDQRRQGIGREVFARICALGRASDIDSLMTSSSGEVAASRAFLEGIGARVVNEWLMSELRVASLNRDTWQRYLARGSELAPRFALLDHVAPWPEHDLPRALELYGLMNTAPQGDLERAEEPMTVARLRSYEAQQAQNGIDTWTKYVVARDTGEFVAYTEVHWQADTPGTLRQGDTATALAYRGRGLAQWLKAAMIERVLRERPQVQRIQTGNAASNAPMLAINTALGFEVYRTSLTWQARLPS